MTLGESCGLLGFMVRAVGTTYLGVTRRPSVHVSHCISVLLVSISTFITLEQVTTPGASVPTRTSRFAVGNAPPRLGWWRPGLSRPSPGRWVTSSRVRRKQSWFSLLGFGWVPWPMGIGPHHSCSGPAVSRGFSQLRLQVPGSCPLPSR